jgi:hypothetical protein
MKLVLSAITVFAMLSTTAFAVLMAADRRLGVPLPYSISFSFAVVSLLVPGAVALSHLARARRPIVVKLTPVASPGSNARPAATTPRVAPSRPVQGVVLLDMSSRAFSGQAA